MLSFLYKTALGRILLKPLIAPWFSNMMGVILSSDFSKTFIKPFIRKNSIDIRECEKAHFSSFNDFFSRKLRSDAREIDSGEKSLISPCDGFLTCLPVREDSRFFIKDTSYSVSELLNDEILAQNYTGGYALIFRLTVRNYHRYIFAESGIKGGQVKIPGIYHTVQPIANDYFPVYKQNTREYCIIDTDRFGKIVQMEVGALMVGKIVNHEVSNPVRRGQEKGYFQFGGSTIILLIKKGKLFPDKGILEASEKNIETSVKMGEKVGDGV